MLLGEQLLLNETNFLLELTEFEDSSYKIRHDTKIFLYVLCHPLTNEIRYVGLTNHLYQRFNSHVSEKAITWKTNWINSLKKDNLKPKMLLLGVIDFYSFDSENEYFKYADKVETEAIIHFGKNGYMLTNHDKLISKNFNYSPNPARKNTKKVYQFDNEFNFIKEWGSQVEIYKFYNVNASTINGAIKEKTKVKGYYFSFENTFFKEFVESRKKCYAYKLNGELIGEFESINDAARKLKTTKQKISGCLNKRQKSDNSIMFSFEKTNNFKYKKNRIVRKVEQFDLDGNSLNIFDSIKEASEIVGVNATNICLCAKNKSKTAGGFIWDYVL